MPRNGESGRNTGRGTHGRTRRTKTALEQLKSLLFGGGQDRPLELTADHIDSILAFRRARDAVFGKDLFSDPAWDMLLELYAAGLDGRGVCLSELALSIGTPQSTTARWIVELETRGIVSTGNHANDALDLRVRLTSKGTAALEELVGHWGSAFRSI